MNILIKEVFKDDFTTRDAGEKLRLLILGSNDKVTLDFKDIKIASASFFDEGIAKLAFENWKKVDFENKIEFINIFSNDLVLIKNTCKVRGIKL